MANMPYCRFQNTLTDFNGCLNTVRDACNDDVSFEDFCEELGSDEIKAMLKLYERAKRFVEIMDQLGAK